MEYNRYRQAKSWSLPSTTASGGFVPMSTYERRMPMTSNYSPSLWSKTMPSAYSCYVMENAPPTWMSKHQVGTPTVTAFDINERGNRVYLKFQPNIPTLFEVKETRFYKPKVHKMDFLGKHQKYGPSREL